MLWVVNIFWFEWRKLIQCIVCLPNGNSAAIRRVAVPRGWRLSASWWVPETPREHHGIMISLGLKGSPQLVPHYAERREGLGQWMCVFPSMCVCALGSPAHDSLAPGTICVRFLCTPFLYTIRVRFCVHHFCTFICAHHLCMVFVYTICERTAPREGGVSRYQGKGILLR